MTYSDNMKRLQEQFPELWNLIRAIEEKLNQDLVKAVTGKKNSTVLQVGETYIHDVKNPWLEAKNLIKTYKIEANSDILFYGIGLGYHIQAFMKEYPHIPFSIYEPVPEVFRQYLRYGDLNGIPRSMLKNLFVETKTEDAAKFCSDFARRIRNSVTVIELPVYQKLFPEKRRQFFAPFESYVRERSVSVNTIAAFEKRWTINSTKNFLQILETPDILLEKKTFFTNRPAVLVAAGPSLEEELDNLRRIKEEGLAYIFSVGSALNTLVQNKIYPHAACTYDPTRDNKNICKEVLEKEIDSIPLIFGSTVGYETLETYPGPRMHMLISQDTLPAYYLKPQTEDTILTISDAATIAVITLQLLSKLGFDPIILVGQNLAYRDAKVYASGSTFHSHLASAAVLKNAVPVKDVYGREVASNQSFISMRQQFEAYLSHYKDTKVINTTRYGAHIEGTTFKELETVLQEHLQSKVVDDQWTDCGQCSYDLEYLRHRNLQMDEAYEKVDQLMENCEQDLDIICELATCGNAGRIEQSYDQYNLSLDALRSNIFFATFIAPMNRLEMEFITLAVPTISAERDPIIKAQMMEKEFRSYLSGCEQDIETIRPLYQEMSKSIRQLCEKNRLKEKAAQVRILLLSGEGVLTDGAIYFTAAGDEMRKFNLNDRTGIQRLQQQGIQVVVYCEANPVIENAAHKLGVREVFSGISDIGKIIIDIKHKYGLKAAEIAWIPEHASEPSLINEVRLSFALPSASSNLQQQVDYVLKTPGGQGVILEIAELMD